MCEFNKIGNFDWIVGYEQLKPYISCAVERMKEINHGELIRILMVGCGTSTLSEKIVKDFDNCVVISVDNDEGILHCCIDTCLWCIHRHSSYISYL